MPQYAGRVRPWRDLRGWQNDPNVIPIRNPNAPVGDNTMGQDPTAAPPAPAGPAAGTYKTRLLEGDPAKLADAAHAAKSPKYDFLQMAQSGKYNYDQMGDMVNALKAGPNGRLWQGWEADGKGNLKFTGDPSQLASEWNGVKSVDAVGSYGSGRDTGDWSQSGWRWGVDEPNAPGSMGNAFGSTNAGALGGEIGGGGAFGMDRYRAALAGGAAPWMSNNTQTGGDALQAIYAMLPGLMGDLGKGSAIDNLTSYWKGL